MAAVSTSPRARATILLISSSPRSARNAVPKDGIPDILHGAAASPRIGDALVLGFSVSCDPEQIRVWCPLS
jgi:hypothetical protein